MKINDVILEKAAATNTVSALTPSDQEVADIKAKQANAIAANSPAASAQPAAAPAVTKPAAKLANVQGATGAKLAQTSGGQFMNKADRLNQAKVDAALGPGFIAGKANTNLALAKKFGQPAAAPAAEPAAPAAVPGGSDGTTKDIERLKQLAIGGEQPAAAPAAEPAPVPAAEPAAAPAPEPAAPATNNAAAAMASKSKSDGSDTDDKILNWQASQPATMPGSDTAAGAMASSSSNAPARDASTVPDAARGVATTPQVSADTGLSTTANPVMSKGGATNVTTGSDDEMAWRATQGPMVNVSAYPGAGNWDPRTGRSKKLQAQADANATAVKGFLNKINPFAKKPAAPVPDQGVVTQAVPPQPNIEVRPLNQSVDNNSEISRIKKLSGL